MKQRIFVLAFFSILSVSILSCKKENPISLAGEKVELYLLESYSRIDSSSQIDESSVILEDLPLIYYSDFLSYDSDSYLFEISDRAKDTIENLENWATAFGITADKTLIYTGYFWPALSSASCRWVVIYTPVFSDNEILVRLGHPYYFEGITDNRNDDRIISIFERDKKLK